MAFASRRHGLFALRLALVAVAAVWLACRAVPEPLALAEERPIVIAGDHAFAPYEFVSPRGGPQGMLVEYWTAWSQATGVPVSYRLMDRGEALGALEQGRVDAVGSLAHTPENDARFEFTHPYLRVESRLFHSTAFTQPVTLDDLGGLVVGVVRGDAVVPYLEHAVRGITFAFYGSTEDLVRAAVAGRLRVLAGDTLAVRYYLGRIGGERLFEASADVLVETPLHAAVRKGDGRTLALLSQGMGAVDAKTVQALRGKWVRFSLAEPTSPLFWVAVAGGALLASAVVLWGIGMLRGKGRERRRIGREQEPLELSGEAFRRIFQDSRDGMCISSLEDGVFLEVNASFAAMYGFDREDMLGVSSTALGIWAQPVQRNRVVRRIRENGEFRDIRGLGRRKDGSIFPVILSSWTMELGSGTVLVSSVKDITDLREAEDALKLTQFAVDNAATEIFWVSETGYFIYANEAAEAGLGYSGEELLTMGVPDVAPDVAWSEWPALWDAHKEQGTLTFESVELSKDGTRRPVEITTRYLRFGAREMLIAYVFDLTERKRAEEEVRRLTRYLGSIIDNASVWLHVTEPDGTIVIWNKAAEEISGYARGEVAGETGIWARLYPDASYRAEVLGEMAAVVSSGKELVDFESVITTKDGRERIMAWHTRHLVDEGHSVGSISLGRDVTEHKRTLDMMIQSEKMFSLGGVAAGMAHEINNPLAGIIQGVQVIERRLESGRTGNERVAGELGVSLESLRAYLAERKILSTLEGIRESGMRAARIITNMLDFSRTAEGEHKLGDLRQYVDNAVELASSDYDLKSKYDFKKVRIERAYGDDLPAVPCSRTELEQVFFNLFKNAAHALSQGEVAEPVIAISITAEDGYAVIDIADNGPGMDEETRRRVFEPFYTTKPVGTGTGLGMSVSYFIITRNHGGLFSVDSAPGQGARFTIKLPLGQKLS